jgi:hypothetical protein
LRVVAPPDEKDQLVQSALTTVCVATAAVAGLKDFPTPDFLRGPMSALLPNEQDQSAEEKAWRLRLSAVRYGRTDTLDEEIIAQVERGYFSAAPIRERIDKYEVETETPLNKAWDIYHNSLDGDTETFVKQFIAGARASLLTTSINNMNSTIRLLRLLDRPELADSLSKEYAQARMVLPPIALDHAADHFFDTPEKDGALLEALDAGLAEKIATLDINETLLAGTEAHYFDAYQTRRLALAKPAELADAFLAADETTRGRIIKTCLELERYADSQEKAAIAANTKLALKQIAGDSKLNQIRILRKYGVKL